MPQPIVRSRDTVVDVLSFFPGPDGRPPCPATVTHCSADGVRFLTSRDYPEGAQVCVRLKSIGSNPPGGSNSAVRILALGQVIQSRPIEDVMSCYQVDVQYHRY
jgi:hypothetical protein